MVVKQMASTLKTNQQIALEVIQGKWGNGNTRRQKLTSAGYNYQSVQSIVNSLMSGNLSVISTEPEPEKVVITGDKIMEVEIDLSVYKGLSITFINGENKELCEQELLEGWD